MGGFKRGMATARCHALFAVKMPRIILQFLSADKSTKLNGTRVYFIRPDCPVGVTGRHILCGVDEQAVVQGL